MKRPFPALPAPPALSADEKLAYDRLQFVYQKGIVYGFQMGLRPQTLWPESRTHPSAWRLTSLITTRAAMGSSRVFDGQSEGLTARDDILDNITFTLVDEHGAFWRPSLLGVLGQRVPSMQRRLHPGCSERLP